MNRKINEYRLVLPVILNSVFDHRTFVGNDNGLTVAKFQGITAMTAMKRFGANDDTQAVHGLCRFFHQCNGHQFRPDIAGDGFSSGEALFTLATNASGIA